MPGILSKLFVPAESRNDDTSVKRRLKRLGGRFSRNMRKLFICGRKQPEHVNRQLESLHVDVDISVVTQKLNTNVEERNLLDEWVPCKVAKAFVSEMFQRFPWVTENDGVIEEPILRTKVAEPFEVIKSLSLYSQDTSPDKASSDLQEEHAHVEVPHLDYKEPAVALVAMLSAYDNNIFSSVTLPIQRDYQRTDYRERTPLEVVESERCIQQQNCSTPQTKLATRRRTRARM